MITLYGMSSPNVRKILIALEEMAVPYKVRHVSVFRGKQFEPDFLELNPLGKVPILVDPACGEGMPIFESGAILIYLAETYGSAFLPNYGPGRYRVLQWLVLQAAAMGPALGNHSHFRLIADDNPYAAARFRRMSAQVYGALNRRLGEASFLGGEAYSIADMAAWPWARYFHRHGMDESDCPHLVDWIARVGERPAVRATEPVMRKLGKQDTRDQALATPGELAMFRGEHIRAPSAAAAAIGIPTNQRRGSLGQQESGS
jgi:GSH-dependent disulfide-bond oxidoreductase